MLENDKFCHSLQIRVKQGVLGMRRKAASLRKGDLSKDVKNVGSLALLEMYTPGRNTSVSSCQ